MEKKLKMIIIIVVSIILIGAIITYFLYQNQMFIFKPEVRTYNCIKTVAQETFNQEFSYEIKVDKEDNVIDINEITKHVYSDKENYFTGLYNIQDKNVDFTPNFDTLTITIQGYSGPVIDTEGETVTISYRDYLNQTEKLKEYTCKLLK